MSYHNKLVKDMTPEEREARNAYHRAYYAGMTHEQHERNKILHLVENLSPEQHERKNAKSRVENMTSERREQQNARDRARHASMPPEQRKRKIAFGKSQDMDHAHLPDGSDGPNRGVICRSCNLRIGWIELGRRVPTERERLYLSGQLWREVAMINRAYTVPMAGD